MIKMRKMVMLLPLLSILTATGAHADVKGGAEAWARGDYEAAVKEWRKPAEQGDPDAQFNMAQAYRLGRGVEGDIIAAQELYALAAAKGHIRAADNYGLLLFQNGKQSEAMPYLSSAADRGDPRAQYIMGIAHFNGDLIGKDWTKAYALLTLANAAGLPQAPQAIAQMDSYIPLETRQEAQLLAQKIRQDSDHNRAQQMAAADLAVEQGKTGVAGKAFSKASPPPRQNPTSTPITQHTPPPSRLANTQAAQDALHQARTASGTESPETAGADYTRTQSAAAPSRMARQAAGSGAGVHTTAPTSHAQPSGEWKVQLGAFAIHSNADKLWRQLSGNPALAGAEKQIIRGSKISRLLATGFATRSAADAACRALQSKGQACIVMR